MDEKEYLHMYQEEEGHWWYAGMRHIVLSLLPTSLLPQSPRALDAGCGTGYFMGWLQEHYRARAIGIDGHPCGLALCRRRGERDLVRGDVAELPFTNEVFDLVTSFDVLSEIQDENSRALALGEFRRVLKPGGKLVVRVPAYEWLRSSHDAGVSTHHRYGGKELRDAILKTGFQPVRSTFANTILFPVAILWRMLKRARLAPPGSDVRSSTRGASWLNSALRSVLKIEAAFLRKGSFSFGLSVFVVASKPVD
jgi:SAM-dependent methyltransferase